MMWTQSVFQWLLLLCGQSLVSGKHRCEIPMSCDGQPTWITTYGSDIELLTAVLKSEFEQRIVALAAKATILIQQVKKMRETTIPSVVITERLRFRSFNFPRHFFGFGSLSEPIIKTMAEWFHVITPGLEGTLGTISFGSESYPGYYLRYRDLQVQNFIYLDKKTEGNSAGFEESATFWPRKSKFIQNYTTYVCLMTLDSTELFIRHQGYRLKLSSDYNTPLLHMDASFKPEKSASDKCELLINNTCYWLNASSESNVTFPIAQNICQSRNSTVADIVNKVHYDCVMQMVKPSIIGYWTGVWIGLQYKSDSVTLSGGQLASYVMWSSVSKKTSTNMYLRVVKNDADARRGMVADASPTTALQGVLCEYSAV